MLPHAFGQRHHAMFGKQVGDSLLCVREQRTFRECTKRTPLEDLRCPHFACSPAGASAGLREVVAANSDRLYIGEERSLVVNRHACNEASNGSDGVAVEYHFCALSISPAESRMSAPARAIVRPVSMPSEPAWKFTPLASLVMPEPMVGRP
jgi:hypothetical protein